MKKIISRAALVAFFVLSGGCNGSPESESEGLEDVQGAGGESVAEAELALTAPGSCPNGSITYNQSKTTASPAATFCFNQAAYDDSGAKYHYKIQYGPSSGGNWITELQKLSTWSSGQFAIRIWYGNQLIVQTIKGAGSVTSPIEATFYGLSGKSYYIQVGILYNNGNFCAMCALPWSTTIKVQSLGKY